MTTIIATATILTFLRQAPALPKESVQQLVSELKSSDLATRYGAFEKLKILPHVFDREDAARAAVALLVTEDGLWDAIGADPKSPEFAAAAAKVNSVFPDGSEAWGPYIDDVQEVVWHYAQRSRDPTAINALLYGPNAAGSELEAWIARQGSAILPGLEAAGHNEDFYVRANVIDEAAMLLQLDDAQPGTYLQPAGRDKERVRAHNIVTNGLKDGHEAPRRQALSALYRLNGPGDRDLVRNAAANDPSPQLRDHARRLLSGYGGQ